MKIRTLLVLALTTAAFTGCASDPNDVSYQAITNDLSPALLTLTERPVDVDRNMAVTGDQNLAMFWEDLGRAVYIDHPSRLTPYPVTYTSGKPR